MSLAARAAALPWRRYMKRGDWATLTLAGAGVIAMLPLLWQGGGADRAIVRRDGELVAEVALTSTRRIEVEGPLGITVIEVAPGRARVLADPGPRQYCVQQGWLTRANALAICAPNHVSLELRGRRGGHDSITY